MKNVSITVGIDIGGTNTVIGFISDIGEHIKKVSIPTRANENSSTFVKRLSETINGMVIEYGNDYCLKGIGIAAPGGNFYTGNVEAPSNLKWGTINLVEMLGTYFDIPIALTNDANAAALGEMYYGKAMGIKNFAVITLGTGLGSGIVVQGELLYGANGLAGELGHTIVVPDGRECNCGRNGCLETYVSSSGIKRTVQVLLGEMNSQSPLRNICFNELDGELITRLAKEGDPIALKAFDLTGELLGKALANFVACFSPETIILFGGLTEAGDLLLNPAKEYFEKNLLNVYKGKVNLVLSNMRNGTAAILGAGSLITDQFREEYLKEIHMN